MSNSSLVSYTKLSPNKNSSTANYRTHKIDTITIHCYVGQASVESMASWLCNPKAGASANYGIGEDGRIVLLVEEKDRSWCSSNAENDNRAITIECASDPAAPYAINTKVYKSLIKLCVDICKRNNIKKLLWKGDKSLVGQIDKQNMTVHRWFANKACPGDYIYNRLGQIADEVNAELGVKVSAPKKNDKKKTAKTFKPYSVKVSIDDLNIRTGAGTNYAVTGHKTGRGVFTIIEEKTGKGSVKGWGRLKSGAGWISLDYTTKVK